MYGEKKKSDSRMEKILLFKGGSLEKYFYGLVGAKIK